MFSWEKINLFLKISVEKKIRLLGNNLERVLDEDESRAIKATSTADEMNGCFLISSIG